CVFVDVPNATIEVRNPKAKPDEAPRRFTFDSVYDEKQNFHHSGFELISFDEIFFPGVEDNPELRGVMPNSFDLIFDHISRSKDAQYLVRASYLEIYKEEIRDLLRRDQSKHLEIKEKPDSGIYVKDLSSVLTRSITEIQKVMNIGYQNRAVGATNMNEHSSRSHAIFIVTVECCKGERLKEATKINLSLSTLGNVISALVDGKSTHIPYRDSKLTRLLQDSFGGNSKTIMVANIGPATYNYEETINTLRYANRAKNIKNRPKINEDPKDALLREYQQEIDRLKALLRNRNAVIPKQIQKQNGRQKSQGKQMSFNGNEVDIDFTSEENGTEDDATSMENYVKEQQAKLSAEKDAVLNDHSLVAEEKSRLLNELKLKESKLQEEQAQTQQLELKLKTMESKLLRGDQSIVEHTRMQELTLAEQRTKMAEQRRREREIVARMEEEEGSVANLQEGFTSLKQEVEVNTRKLKKLFEKLQEIKQETLDVQEEYTLERQEHERIQDQLTREVKLQLIILENFIPSEEKEKLEKRIYFDEETEKWQVKPLFQSTNENSDTNISPEDYEPPQLAPQVVAALEAALQDEEDLELDGR
ncbi:unnamed protein product, partial [Trichobilharzia regenti]